MAIALLFITCLSSCGCVGKANEWSFPETVSLFCEERAIDGVYLKYPFRVRQDDSFLYVMDIHPDGYYGHQFEYPSMKHLQRFVRRGEAPEEFLGSENIRLHPKNSLWVLDANRMKITGFEREDLTQPRQTIALDERLIRTLDFDRFDDSTFIVPDYTGLHRLCFVNLRGEVVKRSFGIPFSENAKDPPIVLAQAWRSFLSYNPANGILAMATQLGQVLEIYDIQNDSVVHVIHRKGMEPRFMVKGSYAIPTGIMGYSDIHVGQEYIYAVFWGHSFDDIKSNKVTKEGGRYIHVFDLQGKPVRQYLLDRYITGFSVDEQNKKIIALDVNSDQPVIEYTY
ncbi:MAG TPA: BF3164 family lipoprotein [Sphingobacteriaceae bacterium]|nr:BF3164 family lipoprotein [Sphingobacteriaceae bacterium]